MIGKNKDLDSWLTKIRAPYERVFSQQNKCFSYKGIEKNQFSAFMEAICLNMKRLIEKIVGYQTIIIAITVYW